MCPPPLPLLYHLQVVVSGRLEGPLFDILFLTGGPNKGISLLWIVSADLLMGTRVSPGDHSWDAQ